MPTLIRTEIPWSSAYLIVGVAWVWGCMAVPLLAVWFAFIDLGGWPLNDDPFYAKPVAYWAAGNGFQWARQGGALTASSVTHVLTGMLSVIGREFSYRPLFLVCIVQQSFGAATLYFIAKALRLSFGMAVLASLTLMFFPLYFGHAFTFMTDGPATAWSCIACVCLAWGGIKEDWRWLCVGSVAVGWGYWIRQTNGLLILAPLIALSLRRWQPVFSSRQGVRQFAAVFFGFGIACLLFETGQILPSSLGRVGDIAPSAELGYSKRLLIATYGFLLLFGWFVIPWLPMLVREAVRATKQLTSASRHTCMVVSGIVLLGGLSPLLLTQGRACITNSTGTFLQNGHFGPIFLSDMDEPGRWGELDGVAWPLWVWTLLSAVSLLSSGAIAWWVAWTGVQWFSRPEFAADSRVAAALGFLLMTGLSAVAVLFFVEPHMDRYWLFLFPALIISLLLIAAKCEWQPMRLDLAWGATWVFLHLGMSIVFTHDMLAWNDTRWRFVNGELAAGLPAEKIDGGRDVNAWLRLDEDANTLPRQGDTSAWWSGKATIALAVGQRPGWHEVTRLPWKSWATGRTHHLLVLERNNSNDSTVPKILEIERSQ